MFDTPFAHAIFSYVVAPLIPITFVVVAALLAKLVAWLHARTAQTVAMRVLTVATELVGAFVARAEVELKPLIQKDLEGGALTASEGAELKAAVIKLLKDEMPQKLAVGLTAVLGGAVDGWLSGKVEQAVTAQAALPSPKLA